MSLAIASKFRLPPILRTLDTFSILISNLETIYIGYKLKALIAIYNHSDNDSKIERQCVDLILLTIHSIHTFVRLRCQLLGDLKVNNVSRINI